MKQKLKSPEVAKASSPKFVRKLLKKHLSEPITTPTKFFYDSAFDYEKEGEEPFFFIADSLPNAWRTYVKANKLSKTFVAGICKTDEDGHLELVAEIGKGNKNPVLKLINKHLLKPFSKAHFVEALSSSEEVSSAPETEETDDDYTSISPALLIKEAEALEEEGRGMLNALKGPLEKVEKPLAKDQPKVTDDLIEATKEAIDVFGDYDIAKFQQGIAAWLDLVQSNNLMEDSSLQESISMLRKLDEELTAFNMRVKTTYQKASQVKLVESPEESDMPLISRDPFVNFDLQLHKVYKKSDLKTLTKDAKVFKA